MIFLKHFDTQEIKNIILTKLCNSCRKFKAIVFIRKKHLRSSTSSVMFVSAYHREKNKSYQDFTNGIMLQKPLHLVTFLRVQGRFHMKTRNGTPINWVQNASKETHQVTSFLLFLKSTRSFSALHCLRVCFLIENKI